MNQIPEHTVPKTHIASTPLNYLSQCPMLDSFFCHLQLKTKSQHILRLLWLPGCWIFSSELFQGQKSEPSTLSPLFLFLSSIRVHTDISMPQTLESVSHCFTSRIFISSVTGTKWHSTFITLNCNYHYLFSVQDLEGPSIPPFDSSLSHYFLQT